MTKIRIMVGDVLERLGDLPDKSVHCCVTSPPYWGLRDYGTALWLSGNPDCDHQETRGGTGAASSKQVTSGGTQGYQFKDVCQKCGAIRVDKQLGLEPTVEEYIEKLTAVFEEVRRVLRDDGTLWLNMGDCYAGGPQTGAHGWKHGSIGAYSERGRGSSVNKVSDGLKPKDLVGQPWRLAFALQAAGWYLRSEIIWNKLNPMPESCTDRPTKSHEQIFLLSKKARYFYDAEAVKEKSAASDASAKRAEYGRYAKRDGKAKRNHRTGKPDHLHVAGNGYDSTRNLRDVWKMATQPFKKAHFATFPEELPRKCIMAGTSERGCCPDCGAPVVRVVEKPKTYDAARGWDTGPGAHGREKRRALGGKGTAALANARSSAGARMGRGAGFRDDPTSTPQTKTTGWQPGCECGSAPVPCTVLDPFGGAGTTALVATRMGRAAILTELSPEYAMMARDRIEGECGLLATVEMDEKAKEVATT